MKAAIVVFVGLLVGASNVMAESTKIEAGIASARRLVEEAVMQGQVPGAAMLVAVDGKVLAEHAFGYAQINDFEMRRLAAPRGMQKSTVFDLASVTKVMATTMAVMILVDQKKLDLDEPVHMYLPDFRGAELDLITSRHLLTHTAGLVQWTPLYYQASNKADVYKAIRGLPLQWPVGEGFHYSDLGFMILGTLVERIAAMPLDKFLDEALYRPLGLTHTGFLPRARGLTDFAATEAGNGYERHMIYGPNFGYGYKGDPTSWDGWRRYVLDGEVNDGNAWYANGGVAGHAGLFSTAGELKVLMDLLLGRGTIQGRRFLGAQVVDTFLAPNAHLGWRQPEGLPPGAFAHTGFTGTYVLGVPEAKLAFILLTNRQNAGTDPKGFFADLGPLQEAASRALLEGFAR